MQNKRSSGPYCATRWDQLDPNKSRQMFASVAFLKAFENTDSMISLGNLFSA